MARGKFITLEGGEGVGKTTNIQFIANLLHQRRIDSVCSREPGGTPLAEKIRELLLTQTSETLAPTAELLLVFAARAQHIEHVIKPALNSGKWVICDRFTDATYAYQGAGRGLNDTLIAQLEHWVQGELQPDVTLLLDIDPESGMQRARARAELDRFEAEEIAFFHRVRASYLKRAQHHPERYIVLDAGESLSVVQSNIEAALQPLLEN